MEWKYEERASRFTVSKGRATNGSSCNYIIKRNAENVISYLAISTLIQGKQKKQSLVEAQKEGVEELKGTNPKFKGFWILNHLHVVFCMSVNSMDEFQFGDYVSGDEKLFCYTA
eukprot:913611-Ditylum_brightwellii.AAC.1